MKTIGRVISIMCVLHVLAALGFAGYLWSTDRLSRGRLAQVKELFAPTLAQEQAAQEAAAAAEADALAHTERVMAITEKVAGKGSADERVEDNRTQQELMLGRLERTQADVEALRRNLRLAQDMVRKDQEELAAKQAALQQRLDEIEQRANDEGFKKAVAMYESLPPAQAKQMFVDLMDGGAVDQVVAYLDAMQARKAAGVMKEFKTAAEVERAVELTERLRSRGSDLVGEADAAAAEAGVTTGATGANGPASLGPTAGANR